MTTNTNPGAILLFSAERFCVPPGRRVPMLQLWLCLKHRNNRN